MKKPTQHVSVVSTGHSLNFRHVTRIIVTTRSKSKTNHASRKQLSLLLKARKRMTSVSQNCNKKTCSTLGSEISNKCTAEAGTSSRKKYRQKICSVMKKTGSESVTTSSVQNQMALCDWAMVEITQTFLNVRTSAKQYTRYVEAAFQVHLL